MSTLKTQYENYLIKNPTSTLTYDEWFEKWGEINKIPYVSDDFQIGPNGAFEYSERKVYFQKISEEIYRSLKSVKYSNGDISDLGNEIGISVGNIFKDMSESEISMFVSGFKHGVSLTNGTH